MACAIGLSTLVSRELVAVVAGVCAAFTVVHWRLGPSEPTEEPEPTAPLRGLAERLDDAVHAGRELITELDGQSWTWTQTTAELSAGASLEVLKLRVPMCQTIPLCFTIRRTKSVMRFDTLVRNTPIATPKFEYELKRVAHRAPELCNTLTTASNMPGLMSELLEGPLEASLTKLILAETGRIEEIAFDGSVLHVIVLPSFPVEDARAVTEPTRLLTPIVNQLSGALKVLVEKMPRS